MLHARNTFRLSRKSTLYCLFNRSRCHHTLLTLAIETSCDDTAVAILEKDDENISNTTLSQAQQNGANAPPKDNVKARLLFNEKVTAPNTGLGGIHPLEALDSHQANLAKLIARAVRFLPDAKPVVSSSSMSTSTVSSKPHQTQKTITIERDHANINGEGNGDGKYVTKRLPDFISVTRGPGMRSNLHCGLDTAKGLSVAWSIPILGVHHMQAHALTPRLVDALEADKVTSKSTTSTPTPTTATTATTATFFPSAPSTTNDEPPTKPQPSQIPSTNFPFLTLLISGGHTMLLHSHALTNHTILATTADVAIGDALDKAGRTILPEEIKREAKDTAFAKHLSEFAFPDPTTYGLWDVPRRREDEIIKGDGEFGWRIRTPFADTREMVFSFTSIASTVDKIVRERGHGSRQGDGGYQDGGDASYGTDMSLEERKALGRAAIGTAFEHLASRTVIALQSLQAAEQPISSLVVSGGVAANPFLRYFLRAMLDARGFGHVRLVFPPPWLCTDNAAMIAWCGMEMYEAGYRSELGIGALRKWSMDREAADGGILGVGGWIKS